MNLNFALAKVHIEIAVAHRDTSRAISYSMPKAARTCRKLMREHACKAIVYLRGPKPTRIAAEPQLA